VKSDPEHLLVPLVRVAVETNAAAGEIIKNTLSTGNLPIDLLKRIAGAIPYPTLVLAEAGAVVLQELADASGGDTAERAHWLLNVSVRLQALGRPEEALTAIEEAVNIRSALTQDQSDADLADLALMIHNRAGFLWKLRRYEEAVAGIDEAVTIYRQLIQAQPDAYLDDLAASLSGKSLLVLDLGRYEEALAAIEEAVDIYRRLVRPNTSLADLRSVHSSFLADLAGSLINYCKCLFELGRKQEALAAINEAIIIYRVLARFQPDAFLGDLAESLNGQSLLAADLGWHEEALAAISEATSIYRQLARTQPDVLANLAASLNKLADILMTLKRDPEADTARAEAAELGYGA